MAENLCTGHELIIKAYDEVGGELLYSGGFITEPNDTVEDFLLENNIILSNAATAEVECDFIGSMWEIEETYFPSRETMTFYDILSQLEDWRMCDPDGERSEDSVEGNMTEIPATVVMSIYGALKKENNQHGAIFTWHSVPYDDYSAMRGPCPEGFHVPSATEWQGLKTIMDGLSLTTGDSWRINLHMPFAGYRTYRDVSLGSQGSYGRYLSSSPYSNSTDNISTLMLNSSSVNANTSFYRTHGYSMRSFKDSYVSPDSNWIVVQGTLGSAGIFWNQSQGLISITDGTTGYTMMDKNLGATTVYNDGDTLTQANMGNMYQWGNNYGFPSTGTITNTSTTKVDASSYGPTNPYSSDTFIFGNANDWSSVRNNDLWGWVTGVQSGYKLLHKEHYIDYSAMRGPCPEGFHIPTYSEWTSTRNTITTTLGIANNPDTLKTYLKIALSSMRGGSGTVSSGYDTCYLWTSSASLGTCVSFRLTASTILSDTTIKIDTMNKNYGYCIRPFKDVPVVPNSTRTVLYNGSSVAEGAGIFWNSTDGLISISGDGVNWTTIADKNLGATVVYNDGDTPTQNNCGGYFQRGNNYMFPFTGSVTTDGTEIDASSYGPGNYYSSNLWKTSACRDTSKNTNLRGATTGVIEGERRVI